MAIFRGNTTTSAVNGLARRLMELLINTEFHNWSISVGYDIGRVEVTYLGSDIDFWVNRDEDIEARVDAFQSWRKGVDGKGRMGY